MNKQLLSEKINEFETMQDFAKSVKVNIETIKKLLYSKNNREPSFETAEALAEAWGVGLDEIYKPSPKSNAHNYVK